ncbi:hypothetical protein FDECE_7368 [Fusarium decemcellulare]|nr:hypothetical protein FDECE_7368 [Fusarium decemcellulare]
MIPAEYAREAFNKALNSADAYSHLTIKCGDKQHRVHKALVCTRSPFFAKACSGPFKESQTNVINLVDDDPEAVDAMISYLYYGSYPKVDPEVPRPRVSESRGYWSADTFGEDTIGLQAQYLPLHAKVYALAEKYHIPDLKALAALNFSYVSQRKARSSEFAQASHIAYNSTIDNDMGLRNLVLEAMYSNPECLDSETFKSVLRENPDMTYDFVIFERQMKR